MIDGSFRELFSSNELNLYAVFQHHKYPLEYNDRYSLTKYFGVSAYKKFTFHIELELDESLPVQSIAFLHHMAIRQHRCNYHMWAIGQSSRPCPKFILEVQPLCMQSGGERACYPQSFLA